MIGSFQLPLVGRLRVLGRSRRSRSRAVWARRQGVQRQPCLA